MIPLPKYIKALFIDREVQDLELTRSIAAGLSGLPCEIVDGPEPLYKTIYESEDPESAGKEYLYLTKNRGSFIRKCPGTREYTCCGYQILHIGAYCTMDCAYCILQSYFHPPSLQFFVNHDDLFDELDVVLASKAPDMRRMGTGEFTDSMIWEPLTGLAPKLVERFAKQSHSVLELKSKTVNIQGLDEIDHNRKTIMAWSVNTPKVIAEQERNTTALEARLAAAEKCQSWGYPLAFHFDPMVIYPGCEDEYEKVVRDIFSHASPDNVVWISLGAFRFMPDLKQIISRRFPDSKIIYGEFISGLDQKMRYFKPLRIALFKRLGKLIKELAPDVTVYFCMEDEEVWEKSLGFYPGPETGLPSLLDLSARRVCNLE